MERPPIELRGVRKSYPRFSLGPCDVRVSRGKILGLIGPNGAGKSTLLRILMGLVRADSGEVAVLGRRMPADERWIKARVGFVSEDMALYGAKTLRWHMDLVSRLHEGWDAARAAALAQTLSLDPDQRIRGLSRGQHVKAMLLLALARQPEVLILDEPTAGLDPLVRHEVIRLLRTLRDDRQAIVFSSHHGEDVSALADDVAFVDRGRIVQHAPVGALLAGGQSLEAVFLDLVSRSGHGRAA
jgi:ABC-2 type transport system ATP-binding protein